MQELKTQAAMMLQEQFGKEAKWLQINQAIWDYFQDHPKDYFSLSNIEEMASIKNLNTRDFLSVLGLLANPSRAYIRLVYYRNTGEEVPENEFMNMLRKWWRHKSISDTQWQEWASQVKMGWQLIQ